MYTFTKLHDRCIPNICVGVSVGVSPMEFQLNQTALLIVLQMQQPMLMVADRIKYRNVGKLQ